MPTLKLTKLAVEKLPTPDKGQVDYFDTEEKGFGVRVSATAKTYFIMKRVHGRLTRVSIGKHGHYTADSARAEAKKLSVKMNDDIDPNEEAREKTRAKKAARQRGLTLGEAFEEFLEVRQWAGKLKPKSIYVYRGMMNNCFSDWMGTPVSDFTDVMISRRYRELVEKRGRATANSSMRTLRSVLNRTRGKYKKLIADDLFGDGLAELWSELEERKGRIKTHDLPAWYQAVMDEINPTIRDYLLLLLFTGMRREEAMSLKWSDVDLKGKTFTVKDTKNGEPLTLPLSDYLYTLLKHRRENFFENEYVFPGTGKKGHLVEPKKAIKRVMERSGTTFTLHDLRRTFTSTANKYVSVYTIKRLINHQIDKRDVTDRYVVADVDDLREPMQKITDAILKAAEVKEPGKVVSLRRATT